MPNPQTRRRFLTGAAAVPAALALPATAAIPSGDAELLAEFHRWADMVRALDKPPMADLAEEDFGAAVTATDELAYRIVRMPASSAAGMAVKMHLMFQVIYGVDPDDSAAIDPAPDDNDFGCVHAERLFFALHSDLRSLLPNLGGAT